MTHASKLFEALQRQAREDPNVLALWLGGSRGKGLVTAHSDYDCVLIVTDEAYAEYRDRWPARDRSGLDLQIMTLGQFEAASRWGQSDAWDAYSYAYVVPLVDKTGRIAGMMRDKARVPDAEVAPFISACLDHFTNQIYRALKCRRDGDPIAARLEAAEAVAPLLNAVFALNGGRLRPYYKYLAWELNNHPLDRAPWTADDLPTQMAALSVGDDNTCREVFVVAERFFRLAGFGAVFDAWGDALDWMLGERS